MKEGKELLAQGEKLALELFGDAKGDVGDLPLGPTDDLPTELVTWLFGYLLSERTQLTLREKLLCLIAMCTVRGFTDMLERWLPAARKAGCSRDEVRETMVTMLVYGGWPTARMALETLDAVWPASGDATTTTHP